MRRRLRVGRAKAARARARHRAALTSRSALIMLVGLGAANTRAQDTLIDNWEFSVKTDNDTLLDTDRFYTNGLWINALKVEIDRWFGWSIANETYTPSDISLPPEDILPDDRPYAGWSYVSYFRGHIDEDDAAVIWEFGGGCIGPCSRAERFQAFWHSEVVDVPEAQGWAAQVTDEVGVHVRRIRMKPIRQWLGDERGLKADLMRTTEFRLGNIKSDATIGMTGRLRLGNMRGYFDGAGVGDLVPKRAVPRSSDRPRDWVDRPGRGWLWSDESFVYAHIEGALVARDSTIQGGLFNDDSPFTQDIRHVVIRTEIGIKFVWRRVLFGMSWNSTSTDFASWKSELNHHNWMSFYVVAH